MSAARQRRRLLARIGQNAAVCGMALTEWLALPRAERRRRIQNAHQQRPGGDKRG